MPFALVWSPNADVSGVSALRPARIPQSLRQPVVIVGHVLKCRDCQVALDRALGMHGGAPKGPEKIAARWADSRKVPQVAFKPDRTKHGKAGPFKRNDQMLTVMPIGVVIFPGTGIEDNLADKARKLGIPVYRFGSGGA